MKCLVIGANGYLGSHLANSLLDKRAQVFVVSRAQRPGPRINELRDRGAFYLGSLSSWLNLECPVTFDVIYSLAGLGVSDHGFDDISSLVEAQVTAQIQALEIARQHKAIAILPSTYWTETKSRSGSHLNLYAALNSSLEITARYFSESFGLSIRMLSLADTYGPEDWRNKLIPQLFAMAGTGQQLLLGSPGQVIAPIYVTDVTDALVGISKKQIEDPDLSRYQILPNTILTVQEVVELVELEVGEQINVLWNARELIRDPITSINKRFPAPPGWRAQVDFKEGLHNVSLARKSDIGI